jgi:hypothetical protein
MDNFDFDSFLHVNEDSGFSINDAFGFADAVDA